MDEEEQKPPHLLDFNLKTGMKSNDRSQSKSSCQIYLPDGQKSFWPKPFSRTFKVRPGPIPKEAKAKPSELDMATAANVEAIRLATIQKIAESRSQGTVASSNEAAAQDAEIMKYVELTSDTSVLDLLQPSLGEVLKSRDRSRYEMASSEPIPYKRRKVDEEDHLKAKTRNPNTSAYGSPTIPNRIRTTNFRKVNSDVELKNPKIEEPPQLLNVKEEQKPNVSDFKEDVKLEPIHDFYEEAKPSVSEMTPAAPTPKTSYKPARMPGLITSNSLHGGAVEKFEEQKRKDHMTIRRLLMENTDSHCEPANFDQPVHVIWRKKSVIVPEYVRCVPCGGLMYLWLKRFRMRNVCSVAPAYKCKSCLTIRSFARKFDDNKEFAATVWPIIETTENTKTTKPMSIRDLDEEALNLPPRKEYKRRIPPKVPSIKPNPVEDAMKPSKYCRDKTKHLSADFHCGCGVPKSSETHSASTSNPTKSNNEQKEQYFGKMNLRELIQKVLDIPREESLNVETLEKVSAKEFAGSLAKYMNSKYDGFKNK